jgi:uncharacterized protein YbaR (Trm112 family)
MTGPSGVDSVLLALICCPKCGGPLDERSSALACRPCRRSWPVEKGVPLLVNEAKLPQRAHPKRQR